MDRLFSLLADGRAASVMREVRIKRNRGKVISAVLMSHTINVLPESAGKTMHAQSQKRTALCAVWIKKDENTFLRVHDKTNSPDKRRFPYEIRCNCHAVVFISRK